LIVPASITSSAFPDSYSRVGLCLYPCPITRHSPLSSLCSHFWGASPALHCSLWIIHRPSLLFYTITSCPLLPLLLSFTEFPGFDCSAFPLIKWPGIAFALASRVRRRGLGDIYMENEVRTSHAPEIMALTLVCTTSGPMPRDSILSSHNTG
jgi:hypothetical protein